MENKKAFNIFISLQTGSFVSSYTISIGCIALKRLRNEPLLPAYFRLRRTTGLVLNILSILFLSLAFVMVSHDFGGRSLTGCASEIETKYMLTECLLCQSPSSPPNPAQASRTSTGVSWFMAVSSCLALFTTWSGAAIGMPGQSLMPASRCSSARVSKEGG